MYQRSLPLPTDGEMLLVEPLPDGKKYLESAKMKSGGMSRVEVKCSIATFERRSLAPSFGITLVFFFTRNLFTNLGNVEHMGFCRSYRDLQAAILVTRIGRYLSDGLVRPGAHRINDAISVLPSMNAVVPHPKIYRSKLILG